MPGDKKRWLFVINPVSGDIDKSDLETEVRKRLEGKAVVWEWMETTGQDDQQRVEDRTAEFRPDTIVAGGGDGTVHMVAQVAVPQGITLGILPLGSANGLARELELPNDPFEALSLIIRGDPMELDVLKINDILCIHLCDIGLNATVVKRFDKAGYRGIFGYFRQYVREIRKVKSKKFKLREDGAEKDLKALMVIATHMRYLGTGAVINPGGDPADGYFEVCVIKKFPLWMVFRIALTLFTGNIRKLKYVNISTHRELELENVSGADFQVDGEPQPLTRHLRMETYKLPLRVIASEERK